MVQITLVIEVDDEFADSVHSTGITEEANLRLFGGEGLWLGDVVDGPNQVEE